MATLQNFAYSGNPITEVVSTSSSVSRKVNGIPMVAEPLNGKATFHYENLLRTLYEPDNVKELTRWVSLDYNIFLRADISGTEYVFLRGVAQVGESEVGNGFAFLHTLPYLRLYRNGSRVFPLSAPFVIDNKEGNEFSIKVNGEEVDDEGRRARAEEGVCVMRLDLSAMEESGEIAVDAIDRISTRVEVLPIPSHPFYIRWVNNKGGYDYYMFAPTYKHTISLAEQVGYEPYQSNGERAYISKRGERAVEASSGMTDALTLQALALMPLSPDIRLYDEKASRWVRVAVEASAHDVYADRPRGEMVFKFILPTLQTNK